MVRGVIDWIGGWVDLKSSLDTGEEKISALARNLMYEKGGYLTDTKETST
jgi:hypothetical protein